VDAYLCRRLPVAATSRAVAATSRALALHYHCCRQRAARQLALHPPVALSLAAAAAASHCYRCRPLRRRSRLVLAPVSVPVPEPLYPVKAQSLVQVPWQPVQVLA